MQRVGSEMDEGAIRAYALMCVFKAAFIGGCILVDIYRGKCI
jgi:hypothetical protein